MKKKFLIIIPLCLATVSFFFIGASAQPNFLLKTYQGSALVFHQQPFTLNLNQHSLLLTALNESTKISTLPKNLNLYPAESLMLYDQDLEPKAISIQGWNEKGLVFAVIEKGNMHFLQENTQGRLKAVLDTAYDK